MQSCGQSEAGEQSHSTRQEYCRERRDQKDRPCRARREDARVTQKQWLAIGSVVVGVSVMTIAGGGLPWVSLVLAVSFAMYALVKKKAQLPALIGLLLETVVLLPFALVYLVFVELDSGGALQAGDAKIWQREYWFVLAFIRMFYSNIED